MANKTGLLDKILNKANSIIIKNPHINIRSCVLHLKEPDRAEFLESVRESYGQDYINNYLPEYGKGDVYHVAGVILKLFPEVSPFNSSIKVIYMQEYLGGSESVIIEETHKI